MCVADKKTGEEVAIKCISKLGLRSNTELRFILNEAHILTHLSYNGGPAACERGDHPYAGIAQMKVGVSQAASRVGCGFSISPSEHTRQSAISPLSRRMEGDTVVGEVVRDTVGDTVEGEAVGDTVVGSACGFVWVFCVQWRVPAKGASVCGRHTRRLREGLAWKERHLASLRMRKWVGHEAGDGTHAGNHRGRGRSVHRGRALSRRRAAQSHNQTGRLQRGSLPRPPPPAHSATPFFVCFLFSFLTRCALHQVQGLRQRSGHAQREAAGAFRQVLQAVAYLHAHNVVHADLKPENFLLEEAPSEGVTPRLKLIGAATPACMRTEHTSACVRGWAWWEYMRMRITHHCARAGEQTSG
jgi:serine/threonine protein kinase